MVAKKINAGQPTLGCFLGLGSPHVAELLAHAGFDWLVIETEHNALEISQVEQMLMAVGSSDVIPIVRLPSADPIGIQRVLDVGAMGILAPMVNTAADVEAIVRATRYPPAGKRSFGPLRASNYTLNYKEYLERANDNILVAVIIETAEAVQNLDEIATVAGLDVLVMGLFDLSLSYNKNPHEMPFPEIDAAVEHAVRVGKEHGVAVGIGVSSPGELDKKRQQGFTFLSYGSDYSLLLAGAQAGLKAFHSQ